MRIKDIALIGMMSAILITIQIALSFLPNVELVSLLIILFTLIYRSKALYIIYIFVLVEGLIYGFGLWWINYLYVWLVLYIITMLIGKKQSRGTFVWATVSSCFGFSFGALCSIPYFFIGGIRSGFAYWVSGIPFDITHGIFNFIIMVVLFRPLYQLLTFIDKRTSQ